MPKLAGFEYLEGPEVLVEATKKLRIQNKKLLSDDRGRNANADLMFSNSNLGASFMINDDDENFIYEDQAANGQEGDQPLRRFEDIVGQIRKDFTKNQQVASPKNQ